MKKTLWIKRRKKYLAFALAFALLSGTAGSLEFPIAAQAASEKAVTRFSEEFDEEMAEWIDAAGAELEKIAQERAIMALVYLSD